MGQVIERALGAGRVRGPWPAGERRPGDAMSINCRGVKERTQVAVERKRPRIQGGNHESRFNLEACRELNESKVREVKSRIDAGDHQGETRRTFRRRSANLSRRCR